MDWRYYDRGLVPLIQYSQNVFEICLQQLLYLFEFLIYFAV
jgi:hypothetical protein